MNWTSLHASLLAKAFENLLDTAPTLGTIAYTRSLDPSVVEMLGKSSEFTIPNWNCYRVAESKDPASRSITADKAVEIREDKKEIPLFLVDTQLAGAGMDGIYSAGIEIKETKLFEEAQKLALQAIKNVFDAKIRDRAKNAVKIASGGRRNNVAEWTVFDFYVQIAAQKQLPGKLLWMIGLWPLLESKCTEEEYSVQLQQAKNFREQLLGRTVASKTPAQRIKMLRIMGPVEDSTNMSPEKKEENEQIKARLEKLDRFLRENAGVGTTEAFEKLGMIEDIWINNIKQESTTDNIQGLEIIPWVGKANKLLKWSGLVQDDADEPPVLYIDPQATEKDNYAHIEVHWKPLPGELEKNSVQYHVAMVSDHGTELLSEIVTHSAKNGGEKYKFTHDDLVTHLGEDANLAAKIVVSVVGQEETRQETQEFRIRTGEKVDEDHKTSAGNIVRSLVEGVIESPDPKTAREIISDQKSYSTIPGFAVFRNVKKSKSYRISLPSLIEKTEKEWFDQEGAIGRWILKVRNTGNWAGAPHFETLNLSDSEGHSGEGFEKLKEASKKMASHLSRFGGSVGHVYDQDFPSHFATVRNYMTAWEAFLQEAPPMAALANTVEIQNLSGKTIGLIVLPIHAMRVAWHVAYDNLLLYARYLNHSDNSTKPVSAKEFVAEMQVLDGSMFPTFLPGVEKEQTFLFGEMLGFHAVGMISSEDSEPKAALAILARALTNNVSDDTKISGNRYNAEILGKEILKYIDCHGPQRQEPTGEKAESDTINTMELLKIHALRPGDGKTVARSLGYVQNQQSSPEESRRTSFILELYSESDRHVVGRFISDAGEKRRKGGGGSLLKQDQWMLKSFSLPNGVTCPRLCWKKQNTLVPEEAAHLAVSFDMFDSTVSITENPNESEQPHFAYGLLAFFDRKFEMNPSPQWYSYVPNASMGEKHPGGGAHTERLNDLVKTIQAVVARNLGTDNGIPVLHSAISAENAENLETLHQLCDWVITFDRNAGIEYFDSRGGLGWGRPFKDKSCKISTRNTQKDGICGILG